MDMNDKGFMDTKGFVVAVISRGDFVDDLRSEDSPDAIYRMQTATLRLNRVALDAYYEGIQHNTLDTYGRDADGIAAYKANCDKHKAAALDFERQVKVALGFDPDRNLRIVKVEAEVFAAFWGDKIVIN